MTEERTADFAEMLRRARRVADLSQEELAERAGLSARAISALERGVNRAPRPDTLDMLADALALSPDERRRWQQMRRQQASRPGEPSAHAATRAAPLNNLPSQPTRFFGREDDIVALTRTLHDADTRLVTLTGPGGTGKTRLALRVASSLLDTWTDGVVFVDLAPISDPRGVMPAMRAALGLWPSAGQPDLQTIAEWLRDKHLLLVLDNLEQVLAAAPEIGDLLALCPAIQVLATSRAPLRLRAEREFPVLPLPVGDVVALAESTESAAVRLFFDRARAVRPDFDEDTEVVARICRQLDGLPLAIELGAASVRLFPPLAIHERLLRRLPLAESSLRDAPARQRTLRDTIAWSYDLLPPSEQALFRRLSIFKGGWMLDGAEAVAEVDVLQGTEMLIEHSLIQSHPWLDGSPRFTMLETIREFGLDQLSVSAELDDTHRRHAAFLLHLNAESVEHLRSPRFRSWLQHGDAEIENVRLALDWATIREPELALRLAREVGWYLLTRGAFVEAAQRLEQALANANNIPDGLRAGVLFDIGMYATTYGSFETAQANVEQAMSIYQQLNDQSGIAECLHSFGRIAMWAGEPERAKPLFEEAIVRFRQLDSSTLTVACDNLAVVLLGLGQLDRAADMLAEGLANGERRGDVWASVLTLSSISDLERLRGNLADARQAMRRAMVLLRELQDPRYIAQSIEGCATLALTDGAVEQSVRLLGAASHLRETIGLARQPLGPSDHDRVISVTQEQISAEAWNRAWEIGNGLSQSEAIDLALDGLGTDDA